MKIERQIMAPKSTFTKSKLIMTDIDNEWNDFLMVRGGGGGYNWKPSADADDDGDNNGKNNKNSNNDNNHNNHNNEKNNCDKKYKVYKV